MRYLLKLILALIVVGFLAQIPSLISAQSQLTIAEERVAQALEEGTNTLDFSDLTQLMQLPKSIGSAKRLQYLKLSGTRIKDLSPLAGLTNLRQLDLNNAIIKDLAPLAGHPSLRVLYLHNTWVSDLSPLAQMPGLERLDIGKTQIASLSPVTGISTLNWLNLHGAYALDGSRDHFSKLQKRDMDISGGKAFIQGYRPDHVYRAKVITRRVWQAYGIGQFAT